MKKTTLVSSALAVFFANLAAHAQAQVTVDVSKITCDQFVEYKIADPKQIATWINGYYHGAHGSPILDAQEMLEITNTVEEHCFKHPGDLVMRSVEGAMGSR
jgi:acid stress chaperone HdeB